MAETEESEVSPQSPQQVDNTPIQPPPASKKNKQKNHGKGPISNHRQENISPNAPITPFKNSEAFLRLNFSQQSAVFLENLAMKKGCVTSVINTLESGQKISYSSSTTSDKLTNLSRFYNIQLRKMSAKNVLKQGPKMKSLYCARCSSPASLTLPKTANGRMTQHHSTVRVRARCSRCGYQSSKIYGGITPIVPDDSTIEASSDLSSPT